MVSQMMLMKGMIPAMVTSNKIQDAIDAYTLAGVSKEDIVVANTLSEINVAMEKEKYVVTNITEYATKGNLVDVVVDATGVPDVGARVAIDAIMNKKTYGNGKYRSRCNCRANIKQISKKMQE